MKKNKRKIRIKSNIIIIFGILCLVVAIYSTYKIIMWKQNVDRNNKIDLYALEYIITRRNF